MLAKILQNETDANLLKVPVYLMKPDGNGQDDATGLTATFIRPGGASIGKTLTHTTGGAWYVTLVAGDVDTTGNGWVTVTGASIYPAGGFADYVRIDPEDPDLVAAIADLAAQLPATLDGGLLRAKVESIAANAITTASINDGAITNAKVADGLISLAKFAAGAIDATVLAASAIGATQLGTGAITAAKFAASAITSTVVAAGAIGNAQVADGLLSTAKLVDGFFTAAKFGANSITSTAIAANAIGSAQVADGLITTAKVADGFFTAAKFAAGAITSTVLAANAVGASQIADAAITVAKLADNAISAAKVATDARTAIRDAVWALAHESGRTAKGVLTRLDAVLTGKATGLLSALATFYRSDGTTKAVEATQDTAAGTRQQAGTISGD